MTFDWACLLTFSAELNDCGDSFTSPEAAYRATISRAYYAAYHCARDFVDFSGGYLPVLGGGTHKELQKYFDRHRGEHPAYGNVCFKLDRLSILRKTADYKDVFEEQTPAEAAITAIHTAAKILDSLNELRSWFAD
jgi:uncharacterized protein (UPF0332 family)